MHSESKEDVINNCLEFINKGYSPLFMKINNYKPLFFQVDKHVTLKLMLKIYVKNIPDFDIRILNGIKLYYGKRLLNMDVEVRYLKLEHLSLISNFMREEEIPTEKIEEHPIYDYSENDFVISQIQNDIKNINEKIKEQSLDMIDKGLFHIFIELKNYKCIYFIADKNMTLKIILKIYAKNIPNFDESILNGIKLYCGKRPLVIDEKIQYLNLKQFCIITNFIKEE